MVAASEKNTGLDPKMWKAVQKRDTRADGRFVYAVRSTGIYCRAICPGRHPTALHSSTGLLRRKPPGLGPANAACRTNKLPAPVWCARSVNTSKNNQTNPAQCPL